MCTYKYILLKLMLVFGLIGIQNRINPHLRNSPILEGHCLIWQVLESCVFSEPHPSVLGHVLILCCLPLPHELYEKDKYFFYCFYPLIAE